MGFLCFCAPISLRQSGHAFLLTVCALLLSCSWGSARADLCTTQARMSDGTRSAIAAATEELSRAVVAGDTAKIKSLTIAEYAANFDPTAFLVRSTSERIGTGGTPVVSEIFQLDGTTRKAGDTSAAEFSCALSGSGSEVDFSITGLPPGVYAFALVDVHGSRPWLLSFLLQQQGSAWKLAGFYPHSREAATHDGLWYWTSARKEAKAGRKWLAWTFYGEADTLLRPANFVTTTHLDALRTEQRGAAPGELSDGISSETPLVMKSTSGQEFRFTDIHAEGSEDGKRLNLILHLTPEPSAAATPAATFDPVAVRSRNLQAASTLLTVHRELRDSFSAVWVYTGNPGQNPLITQHPVAEIP